MTLIKADDLHEWLMDVRVMDDNPLYQGQTYRLKFTFSQNYPIEVRMLKSPRAVSHADVLTLLYS